MGRAVLAPRIAEVDVDAADRILGGNDPFDALDVGAHDLHVVDGAACSLIGGFDLALCEDEHLVGDVDAQIVVFRVAQANWEMKPPLPQPSSSTKGCSGRAYWACHLPPQISGSCTWKSLPSARRGHRV